MKKRIDDALAANREKVSKMSSLLMICIGSIPDAMPAMNALPKDQKEAASDSFASQWEAINTSLDDCNRTLAAQVASMQRLIDGKSA